MKTFKDLRLERVYTTTSTNIFEDVVNQILANSTKYDRSVGFFSSTWLKEVATGLSGFILTGGHARILTSIKLSETDWNIIKQAKDQDAAVNNIINTQILESVETLKNALEYDTLGILSYLITKNILEFKFAIPCGNLTGGIFHSKVSIFYDNENNYIVLAGSQNDSHQASINEETVNLFTSYGDGKLYADDHIREFNKKWIGATSNLKVYTISEAARKKIVDTGAEYKSSVERVIKQLKDNLKKEKNLRDYQKEAIDKWFSQDCKGFFEMATGTGKTFTSISAINKLYKKNGRICCVVIVPYNHLAAQWIDELKENGYNPIPCYANKEKWINPLKSAINTYKSGISDKLCIVTLYQTASRELFQDIINTQLSNVKWLLVADEAHNAGANQYKKVLLDSAIYRIGLSATPVRWYDTLGSSLLKKYFGPSVIEYPLAKAIENKMLTHYNYYPVLSELSDYELSLYNELSIKISKLMSKDPRDVEDEKKLSKLLIQRASVVAKAEDKLPKLIELVKKHKEQFGNDYKFNIYYAPPGRHLDVLKALSEIGLKVHDFVGDTPIEERKQILQDFANKKIDGLVAIKCLDEGVDVPSTLRAYILASTTNPKEFIQRRGRVLRLANNKDKAYIYDFIVGPWSPDKYLLQKNIANSLLMRELPRFAEFNSCADNKVDARQKISAICDYFGLIDELDILPYDLYNKNIELQYENSIENNVDVDINIEK